MLEAPNLTFLDSNHLWNPNEVYFWQSEPLQNKLPWVHSLQCTNAILQMSEAGNLRIFVQPGNTSLALLPG